jgi:hypothetical protein
MKQVVIKLRKPEIQFLGDVVAECVVNGKKYGGVGFGEWYAVKALAENIINLTPEELK